MFSPAAKSGLMRPPCCRWRPSSLIGLLVGLVLTLSLLAASSPVRASGDGITVVTDRWAIQFPGHVSFDLTAQSLQQIVEVRLLYRTTQSRTWTYAYPEFQPGRRVTASFNLNTSGASFLPLGTKLEYYYVIRDAQGNVHQTLPKVLEYADTRFQWEQALIGSLVLMYHDIPEFKVTQVSEELAGELERLRDLLQIKPGQPIKGVIYNHRSAALGAFPNRSRTLTEQHVFEGFAFPTLGLFVGLGLEPRLIIHESAHLLLHQKLGPRALPMPAWLDEGFASYVEPGSVAYSGQSLRSLGAPLENMASVRGTPQDIGIFYLKAESVVSYLIEEHGVESFQGFLGQIGLGRSVNNALQVTYGFGVAGLDSLWGASSEGPPVRGRISTGRPSPFLYFDIWIFAVLGLVVMAAVAVRYVTSKLRPSPDPEEGLQPWEDPDVLEQEQDDDRRP